MTVTGRRLVMAGMIIAVVYAFVMFATQQRFFHGATADGRGIRVIQDSYDRSAFYMRGAWYVLGMKKMRNLTSEYPPVAVYMFAIPFALADLVGEAKPFPPPRLILNLLTAMMVIWYAGLMIVTRRLLVESGKEEWRLFVFILPGFLYFSLNRYDVVPALMVSAAILAAWRNRAGWTGVLLGLGAMTKWYPVILAPLCAVYFWRRKPADAVKLAAGFVVTAVAVSLPLILLGGWEAFLDPYTFQSGRGGDSLSLFGLIASLQGIELSRTERMILLIMQFIVPMLAVLGAFKDREALLDWTLLSLFAFIFFSKFYSPQWIIWIIPLLILRSKSKPWMAMIVVWDLLSYLIFPLLYDFYDIHDNPPGAVFAVVILVKTALLIAFASVPARNVWRDFTAVWREPVV